MKPTHIVIVVPVFNDWMSLSVLLTNIDRALAVAGLRGSLVVVDDGSTVEPVDVCREPFRQIQFVRLVKLRCNVGHQRAIAVGLTYVAKQGIRADAVVVMDGDGEDRPEDIPRLVQHLFEAAAIQPHVVFAARTKRLESFAFRTMYRLYRAAHWFLTGISVRVGNFSALRPATIQRLLMTPDSWNHYAAAVFRSRIPFSAVPVPRGQRYAGASHMRWSDLAAHGLSAIAVFAANVGARLLLLLSSLVVVAVALLITFGVVRAFTGRAADGWGLTVGGLLIVFLMQGILSLLLLALVVLGDRSQAKVVPYRDAEFFIDSVTVLWEMPLS